VCNIKYFPPVPYFSLSLSSIQNSEKYSFSPLFSTNILLFIQPPHPCFGVLAFFFLGSLKFLHTHTPYTHAH
jgi:hypothetical protein